MFYVSKVLEVKQVIHLNQQFIIDMLKILEMIQCYQVKVHYSSFIKN